MRRTMPTPRGRGGRPVGERRKETPEARAERERQANRDKQARHREKLRLERESRKLALPTNVVPITSAPVGAAARTVLASAGPQVTVTRDVTPNGTHDWVTRYLAELGHTLTHEQKENLRNLGKFSEKRNLSSVTKSVTGFGYETSTPRGVSSDELPGGGAAGYLTVTEDVHATDERRNQHADPRVSESVAESVGARLAAVEEAVRNLVMVTHRATRTVTEEAAVTRSEVMAIRAEVVEALAAMAGHVREDSLVGLEVGGMAESQPDARPLLAEAEVEAETAARFDPMSEKMVPPLPDWVDVFPVMTAPRPWVRLVEVQEGLSGALCALWYMAALAAEAHGGDFVTSLDSSDVVTLEDTYRMAADYAPDDDEDAVLTTVCNWLAMFVRDPKGMQVACVKRPRALMKRIIDYPYRLSEEQRAMAPLIWSQELIFEEWSRVVSVPPADEPKLLSS